MAQAAPALETTTRRTGGTSKLARREARAFYGFASPWILGFILFGGGPVVAALLLSFAHWSLLSTPSWAGLANYRKMFADPLFYKSIANTVYFGAGSVCLGVVTSFLLAILLNQKVRGLGFFRTVFYLPSVVAGVATAILWVNILQPDYGLINNFLGLFGIKGPGWLVSEHWAIPGLILMSVWGAGNTIVIYLAGLQSISPALYEAALLDGAGWWNRFWNVTVPAIRPSIAIATTLGIIQGLRIFDQILALTGGGPAGATETLATEIYKQAFSLGQFGFGSALALVLTVIILAFAILQQYVTRDRDAAGRA